MGGIAAGGGISSALGTVASLFSSKMLMKYQYKLNRKLRRRGYQDTMFSMKEAGLNPILAYKQGAVNTGGVGLAASPNFGAIGQGIAAGAQADAAGKQASSAKKLRSHQGAQAAAQAAAATAATDLARSQKIGVDFENIAKSEMAEWYQTEPGKAALHGKGIGGIWGPPAAAAEQLYRNYKVNLPTKKPDFMNVFESREAAERYMDRLEKKKQFNRFKGRRAK